MTLTVFFYLNGVRQLQFKEKDQIWHVKDLWNGAQDQKGTVILRPLKVLTTQITEEINWKKSNLVHMNICDDKWQINTGLILE